MDILENLNEIKLGPALISGDLTIYPIIGDLEGSPNLKDLDEAIESKWIKITEVSDSGSVPELAVNNGSNHNVIIFDGEELIGAKQNRIVNTTIIINANTALMIKLSKTPFPTKKTRLDISLSSEADSLVEIFSRHLKSQITNIINWSEATNWTHLIWL